MTAPAGHVRGPASHVTAPGGHVTADLIAEHYEVQDMSQVRLGPESTTVQDYEVPLEMKTGAKTMNRDEMTTRISTTSNMTNYAHLFCLLFLVSSNTNGGCSL